MNKINWGIIGLGKIAHIFAEDLQQENEASLYAVASRSKEKSVQFAHKFSVKKAYDSYLKLIEDNQIDVIYIATPHALHFNLALACLNAKKHVLCEKPMCLSAKETQILIELSKKNSCFLMEAIWTRFMPSTKRFLEIIQENMIGELVCLEADFGFKAQVDPKSRLFDPSLGGGSLMDIGIYPIFLSLLCFGEPDTIIANATFASTGVDISCLMEFFYKDGKKAYLSSTFKHATPTQAKLTGEHGSILLDTRFHQSKKIEIFNAQSQSTETIHLPYKGNGYVHEIKEVHRCIHEGKTESELLPHLFSLQLAQLLEKVRKQIKLNYR